MLRKPDCFKWRSKYWPWPTKVQPSGEAPPCRHENDRKYLHCALTGGVDYLVTLDEDMLVLGSVGTTVILPPAELLARLRQIDR